ncbi:MAG: hypothetical protein PUA83_07460 [Clostridiales bacterium]|nr:hypothetical protein [Clostridiales bacterium]
MKKTRLLALLLALCMVAVLFAACGNTDPEETSAADTTAATSADSTTAGDTGEDTSAEDTSDAEPAVDVSGMEFNFSLENCKQYIDGEDQGNTSKGEAFQAAIEGIEEKLGCTITISDDWDAGSMEWVVTNATGNVHTYDTVTARQSTWIPAAIGGYIWALDELAEQYGLDIYNEDFCNQTYLKMTELDGHYYALDFSGHYFNTSLGHFYAFNSTLVNEAGTPAADLYQAIRDFKWDYEMFLDIGAKITKDTDGDGTNDIWAVALDCDGNEAWTNGTGPIILDENGKWTANLTDPQLIEALDFMYALSGPNYEFPVYGDTVGRGDRRTMFYSGTCGFAGLYGGNISEDGTGAVTTFEVGVAPIPHGPDAETYMMNIVDCDWVMILKTNPHPAETCAVLNEIGYAITDYDGYIEDMMVNLAGSEECMEVINNYLIPNGKMNIAKCSDQMYEITRKQFYRDIYTLEKTPAQAAEAYNGMVQAEINTVFGY